MVKYFCTVCFREVKQTQQICPYCEVDILDWEKKTPYNERLLHSLQHPIAEVRMSVIISLGNQRQKYSAVPLAHCALEHPKDNVQNLEILRSIEKLPLGRERDSAVLLLRKHPSRIIRRQAQELNLSKSA